jgi:hypothetical protein
MVSLFTVNDTFSMVMLLKCSQMKQGGHGLKKGCNKGLRSLEAANLKVSDIINIKHVD